MFARGGRGTQPVDAELLLGEQSVSYGATWTTFSVLLFVLVQIYDKIFHCILNIQNNLMILGFLF